MSSATSPTSKHALIKAQYCDPNIAAKAVTAIASGKTGMRFTPLL